MRIEAELDGWFHCSVDVTERNANDATVLLVVEKSSVVAVEPDDSAQTEADLRELLAETLGRMASEADSQACAVRRDELKHMDSTSRPRR